MAPLKPPIIPRYSACEMPETAVDCFPEPTIENLSWNRYGPNPVAWLERSTRPQAQRIRRFLNSNLKALPADAASSLCRRFLTDPWRQVYFELVVGRFLQLLGGTLEYEPVGANQRKVDWLATFRDGTCAYVEATSPLVNRWIGQSALSNAPLLEIIEAEAPDGWSIVVGNLPDIGPQESRGPFRRAVHKVVAALPDPKAFRDEYIDRAIGTPQGELELRFRPGRYAGGAIVGSPGGGGVDDCASRIADAVKDKRLQGRAFPGRVFLAIDAPDCEADDADVALFGSTFQTLDPTTHRLGPVEFRPNGSLALQKQVEYPGVLVFNVGVFGGTDPVLYHHPMLQGAQPASFHDLEQRSLASMSIEHAPARIQSILHDLDFPVRE
jgi:hypothetical protein